MGSFASKTPSSAASPRVPAVPTPSPASPSTWTGHCYPASNDITISCNAYFLAHWPFPDEKARRRFVAQNLPRWHCCQYPTALPERQLVGAKFMVLMFLIDDLLDQMSLAQGAAMYDRLIAVIRGDSQPEAAAVAEQMMHDIWMEMRVIDKELADSMEEPCFVFWRGQVDATRLVEKGLKSYLAYRELDVASALLRALQRFLTNLHLPVADLSLPSIRAIEKNYTNHIGTVNDICSFNKELRDAAGANATEGAVLTNIVAVLAHEAGLSHSAAKRILWCMCREWEVQHDAMLEDLVQQGELSGELQIYVDGLKLQMSGNELWSRTTLRYNCLEETA